MTYNHDCYEQLPRYPSYTQIEQCDTCGWWWKCSKEGRHPYGPRWSRRPGWWALMFVRRRQRIDRRKAERTARRIKRHQQRTHEGGDQ